MSKISLAYALKQKNRLVQDIDKLKQKINQSNTYRSHEGNESDKFMTFQDMVNKLNYLTEKLIDLKFEINKANLPIQKKIYKITELKGLLINFRRMNTTIPTITDPSTGRIIIDGGVNYNDEIKEEMLDKMQMRINQYQDEIDSHNKDTFIEFSID